MSAWTFTAKVDIKELLRLANKLGEIPDMMMDVADQCADEVRINIQNKGIIDTGALLDSIASERKDEDTVVVRDGVEYGVYNEFGTHKITQRPFFIPALERFGDIYDRVFKRLFK